MKWTCFHNRVGKFRQKCFIGLSLLLYLHLHGHLYDFSLAKYNDREHKLNWSKQGALTKGEQAKNNNCRERRSKGILFCKEGNNIFIRKMR